MTTTTNGDIIRRAARLMGIVSGGEAPEGADAQDIMELLQGLILDLPGLVKNGLWREVAVSAAYEAREGERVTVTGAFAVTLPATVDPECDEIPARNGGPRPPLDFSRVQVIGGPSAGLFVYIASAGAWAQLDGLASGAAFPFGAEDVAGVAAMLAVEAGEEFGEAVKLGPRTLARAQVAARSFRARFKKAGPADWTRPTDYAATRLPEYY